jgi:hypothetical protein
MPPGCKKDSHPPVPEEDLKISIDAASYTLTPGPSFDFQLKVESAMPAGGVRIQYSVIGEVDNQVYPQGPATTTHDNITRTNISGLPRQKICVCTISVTSTAKPTNTATTSFRVGYK